MQLSVLDHLAAKRSFILPAVHNKTMHAARLPPGLLDLVFAPAQASATRRGPSVLGCALQARLAHSAAALRLEDAGQSYVISDRSLNMSYVITLCFAVVCTHVFLACILGVSKKKAPCHRLLTLHLGPHSLRWRIAFVPSKT